MAKEAQEVRGGGGHWIVDTDLEKEGKERTAAPLSSLLRSIFRVEKKGEREIEGLVEDV